MTISPYYPAMPDEAGILPTPKDNERDHRAGKHPYNMDGCAMCVRRHNRAVRSVARYARRPAVATRTVYLATLQGRAEFWSGAVNL